jgi:hypothetical protein
MAVIIRSLMRSKESFSSTNNSVNLSPFGGHLFHLRRLDSTAIEAGVSITLVVGGNDDDIGFLRCSTAAAPQRRK